MEYDFPVDPSRYVEESPGELSDTESFKKGLPDTNRTPDSKPAPYQRDQRRKQAEIKAPFSILPPPPHQEYTPGQPLYT